MNTEDSFRKNFDELFDKKIAFIRELIEFKLTSNEKARELAAIELARRLDILNHAHQEAIRVQGTYVPREIFDSKHDALSQKMLASFDAVYGKIGLIETWKSNQQGRQAAFVTFMVVATVVVNVLVSYLLKK